jgi:hypothetical protein
MAEVLFIFDEEGYLTVHKRGCRDVKRATLERAGKGNWWHGSARTALGAVFQAWRQEIGSGEVTWPEALDWTDVRACTALRFPRMPDDLYGRRITWLIPLTGQLESTEVPRESHSRHTQITVTRDGRKVVTFVDPSGTGFRSVALDTIVEVR